MTFSTKSDYTAFLADIHQHFSEKWKVTGRESAKSIDASVNSKLARQMGLERAIAIALEELLHHQTTN